MIGGVKQLRFSKGVFDVCRGFHTRGWMEPGTSNGTVQHFFARTAHNPLHSDRDQV